ncbi:MAG: GNAT family N-acetyltransferase [Candidatus Hodarchaeota archaeon]
MKEDFNETEPQKPSPFIKGENICLIPHNSKYINLYLKWSNNWKVRKYARDILPIVAEDMKKWFETSERRTRNYIGFTIWHKNDKKPIGIADLSLIDWVNGWANVGLVIGEPSYWNRNIATEATELIIEYAFNELSLHKLQGCAAVENIGSWKIAEKVGFIFEGIGKQDMYVDGKYLDEKRYCFLREDWLKSKKSENKELNYKRV